VLYKEGGGGRAGTRGGSPPQYGAPGGECGDTLCGASGSRMSYTADV